jgi:formylglycine-generating enzyme required for sulfatase activity
MWIPAMPAVCLSALLAVGCIKVDLALEGPPPDGACVADSRDSRSYDIPLVPPEGGNLEIEVWPDLRDLRELRHEPEICMPDCEGKDCGDDGCGGECGVCSPEATCTQGQCKCTCDGKECGDDGCGFNCGECPGNAPCVAGVCEKWGCDDDSECEHEQGENCVTCWQDCGTCPASPASPDGEFLPCDGGSFWMGSPAGGEEKCPGGYEGGGCDEEAAEFTAEELGRTDAEFLHKVLLTHNFELGRTEVTQNDWKEAFDGWDPTLEDPPAESDECAGNCPVQNVSWFDALAYANWKTESSGLFTKNGKLLPCYVLADVVCQDKTGPDDYRECMSGSHKGISSAKVSLKHGLAKAYDCEGYRLPTEAEWERAIRADSQTAFYPCTDDEGNLYDGSITQTESPEPNLEPIGWYLENADGTTHPTAELLPNAWGLHDLSGNVWEWCWDRYCNNNTGYGDDPAPNDDLQCKETNRTIRGGSFTAAAKDCRSARRGNSPPGHRSFIIGFRLARTLD